MNDRSDFEDLLSDEIKALDEELSSIRYEERPSFGPELEAELARLWAKRGAAPPIRAFGVRQLLAASIGALLLVATAVPSARASLVRWVGVFATEPSVEAAAAESNRPAVAQAESRPASVSVPRSPVAPSFDPPPLTEVDRAVWPAPTFPVLADRAQTEIRIRRAYPVDLQRRGVGGTVNVWVYVDSTGAVDFPHIREGSGVPALDRAALTIAPTLHFAPATRRGVPIATWAEFDVVFEPRPDDIDPYSIAVGNPIAEPEVGEVLDLSLVPEWVGDVVLFAPIQQLAGELLDQAFGDEQTVERLGGVESILLGEPPSGVAPMAWRRDVSEALENAMVRDPDNPAPLLALARIRRKQGLRTEARVFFERGLQRAMRGSAVVSPTLLAELHFERGTLIREGRAATPTAGRVPASAFADASCPEARSSGGSTSGYASRDRLVAWNYLCPDQLGAVFERGYERVDDGADVDRALMMASFRTAVEAYPAHAGANVEILLALADEGRWDELLEGARRFVRASRGHPYGLLLGGLALQRLSRTEEAADQFELALRGLPGGEAAALRDVRFVATRDRLDEYRRLSEAERRGWERRFWAPLDPILSTSVNERSVEHIARAAYAHLRFGTAVGDPGEVWVRYGRPTGVRVVGDGSSLRTEFWDYGPGPDVTFSRVGASMRMDLTAEGRGYLDDLRSVLPHRYGTASRTVYTLPGQFSRFRGQDLHISDVEVFTEVPEILATGATDTLDLGVFLLDAEGQKVEVTQRRVFAEAKPVTLRAPATAEVSSIVVEFYNRRTRQAAALRAGVRGSDGAESSISDLVVAEPATPSPVDVLRHASWLAPLTLAAPLSNDALGAYFELYDLNANAYRISAEVVDRDSGIVTEVLLRPAGESGFRMAWNRTPRPDEVTSEFVTVSLDDVTSGNHTLRILVADLVTGATRVAERQFERR